MKKSCLAINPWVCDFKLYDEWMHPLGLYFLISLLRHNGWDVTYINCLKRDPKLRAKKFGTGDFFSREMPIPPLYKPIPRAYKRYGIENSEFADIIRAVPAPDIVVIGSSMTYWIHGVQETVRAVRDNMPDVPVIVGGIAARLFTNQLRRLLPGCTVYSGSLLGPRLTLKTLHPLFEDISRKNWSPSFTDAFGIIKNLPHGPVLASVGCPLRCAYCASSAVQPVFMHRPAQIIIDEIRYCADIFGARDFAFYDDALLYKPSVNLHALLDAIQTLPCPVRLHAPNGLHIRWVTPDILARLRCAGLKTLRFGYESGSAMHAEQTAKKASRFALAEKLALVHKAGYGKNDIGVYVMGGLPHQTPDDMLSEMDYVASMGVLVKPVFLSPVPKTPLFKHYAESYPQLKTDPLWHNDTFFITQLDGWGFDAVQTVRNSARRLNAC